MVTHGGGMVTHGYTRAKKRHTATQGGATQEEMDPGGRDRVPRGLERH